MQLYLLQTKTTNKQSCMHFRLWRYTTIYNKENNKLKENPAKTFVAVWKLDTNLQTVYRFFTNYFTTT